MPHPKSWFSDKIKRRESSKHGFGQFALEPIEEGEVLLVKGGHIFGRDTLKRLEKLLGPTEFQIADDLFIGPMSTTEREDCMMYLNHSCDPNCGIMGQIVVVAMRDIAPGEEISIDYAMTDDDDYEMPCNCGKARCRGTITGKDWQRPDLHNRYAGYFSAYLDVKISGRI
ncbi:SET domain-containing protein [Aestuariispira insulae]|uniref:SET domain-containing protein n=1 Tax=Aestuariispira insulae TaxID=1461337 RepID=A0A3D9HW30_9PROT|nr:SET domain-containing protein-lysine N-methyltransferase [Aestuariispira insulae]RED53677.1 hypothetical protein DFP90_101469 [Aestuariispira insulae]